MCLLIILTLIVAVLPMSALQTRKPFNDDHKLSQTPNPLEVLAADFLSAAGPQIDAGVDELYELRLAVRTSRVFLSLRHDVNVSARLASSIRWVGRRLARARDADVIFARIHDEASASSQRRAAAILVARAAKERQAARHAVMHALASRHFGALVAAMEAEGPFNHNGGVNDRNGSAATQCAALCARRHDAVIAVWRAARHALRRDDDAAFHELRSLARSTRMFLSLSLSQARGRVCGSMPAPVNLRLASATFDRAIAKAHCAGGRLSDARLTGGWLRAAAGAFRVKAKANCNGIDEGNIGGKDFYAAARLAAALARRERRRGRAARCRAHTSVRELQKEAAVLAQESCP